MWLTMEENINMGPGTPFLLKLDSSSFKGQVEESTGYDFSSQKGE